MTCSLQTYRIRIGTFYPRSKSKLKKNNVPDKQPQPSTYLLLLLIVLYTGLILNVSSLKTFNSDWLASTYIGPTSQAWSVSSECLDCLVWDPGIQLVSNRDNFYNPIHEDYPFEVLELFGSSCSPWLNSKQRNKITHIICGNRGQRGKGINCVYWNKGPAFLSNKQLDIGTIIETHKPHILGLGEANFRHDHDLLDVQQPD